MLNSLSFESVSILDSSHQVIHRIYNKTTTVFVVNSQFIKKESLQVGISRFQEIKLRFFSSRFRKITP